MEEKQNGFQREDFDFQGRKATVIFADKKNRTAKWALKTEYFDAFPSVQTALLEDGFNLAFLENETRWCKDSDLAAKKAFVDFLAKKYGFENKCVVIGMSCGGMIGVKLAAKYPECVSVLYLDAPVMNLLSCPAGLGKGTDSMWEEFRTAMNMELCELISYRNNPIDVMHKLLESNKPIILICGDSDSVVPYEENGKLLNDFYKANGGIIETIVKKNCDHHPHSLDDPTPITDFIKKYA